MNILLGILGALICGTFTGTVTYVLSKREEKREEGGIGKEISELQKDLERAEMHLARIRQLAENIRED
jgi:uncharacterized protein (UPF0128 family)